MDLIKVTEENGEQLVSARDLHEFLESKQDFSDWIKNRIEKNKGNHYTYKHIQKAKPLNTHTKSCCYPTKADNSRG